MATYYVDGAVGDDGNAGTSEGAGNAWATIQQALDTVAAGDKVYVKASATYSEALTDSTAGTVSAPIVFEGYTTTPGDGGIATNDGGGSLADGLSQSSGLRYYVWKNFRFTDFTGTGAGNTLADYIHYYNCRSDNNGQHGFEGDFNCVWVKCHAHDNTSDGFQLANSDGGFFYCYSEQNGGDGYEMEGGVIVGCAAVGNGGRGIHLTLANAQYVIGNLIDGNGSVTDVGIYMSASFAPPARVCINNLIYDCETGIQCNIDHERNLIAYNLVNSMSTGNYANASQLEGEVTGAPAFEDEPAQDYTPDTGSAAIGAGMDFRQAPGVPTQSGQAHNIGTLVQDISAGGGGGLLMPNKRAGKQ